MAENNNSQTHNNSNTQPGFGFDPLRFMAAGFDMWAQLAKDNVGRIQSFCDELAEMEDATYRRAKKGAQDVSELMAESITYVTDLSREWRKLTLEATRRSTELFGSKV